MALVIGAFSIGFSADVYAAKKTSWTLINNSDNTDSDADGLSDWQEINIYSTNPNNSDTDGDSFADAEELNNGYNQNAYLDPEKLPKHIYISIKKQELRYYTGPYLMGDFLISSGVARASAVSTRKSNRKGS